MPARLTLQVVQGAARDWQLQIANPSHGALPWSDSNPSPFQPDDVLEATLWAGQSQASILTLAPTWLNVAAATYTVSVDNAQTAAIVPSMYRLQVTCTRSGASPPIPLPERSAVVGNLRLEVLSAAGATVAGATYCTFEQLVNYAAWVQDLQDDNDMAGFLGQRVRARSWLDDILVSRYRPGGGGYLLPGDPGSGAYFVGAGTDLYSTQWFRQILAANTGENGGTALICHGSVVETVCRKAIYYICCDELSRREDNPYIKLGLGYGRVADNLVKTLRAEIDTNADGIGEYMINCGATSLR